MKRLALILGVLLTLGGSAYSFFQTEKATPAGAGDPNIIAVAGPMSGKDQAKGLAMVNGAQLYVEAFNAGLAEGERPLELKVFDDLNDSKVSADIAREIGADKQVIAVLGHRSSGASIAAAKVYAELGVPMVTGTATAPGVTKDNEWSFRVVPDNNLQGQFVARYAKAIGVKTVSVIFDDDDYGLSLMAAFEASAVELGLSIKSKQSFTASSPTLDSELSDIVSTMAKGEGPGMVFLAVHDLEGAGLIRDIRDRGLDWTMVGSASLGKQSFPNRFKDLKREKAQPGYYTDGLLAASSLIFDVAGEDAQAFRQRYKEVFGQAPDAASAAYYDAAKVVSEAIVSLGAHKVTPKKAASLSDLRQGVRDFLSEMDAPSKGIKGISDLIYFDPQGNVVKSIPVGLYNSKRLVSAPVQLHDVGDVRNISPTEIKSGHVVKLGNGYFYKTNVVYTGITPISLTDFDSKALTFSAEFLLWFRGGGSVEPQDILFLNAIGPVELGQPIEQTQGGAAPYRLYRVKGRFEAQAQAGRDAFGEFALGVAFRHKTIPGANLVYVADDLGMGATAQGWREKIMKSRLYEGAVDWAVTEAAVFQDTVRKSTYGHPGFLNASADFVAFSRFNFALSVQENKLTVRGAIPGNLQGAVLAGSALFLLILLLLADVGVLSSKTPQFWMLEVITSLLLLSSSEAVGLGVLVDRSLQAYSWALITTFDVLWWLVLAYYLKRAIGFFVWDVLERRSKRMIPLIVRNLGAGLIYLGAIFGIIAFVFNQDLTNLLATSGLLAMIIGLAIQRNLSNVFSGITLNMENPFRIGDWVEIGEEEIGKVVEMTWRTTRVQALDGTIITVPNSVAAENIIQNYTLSELPYSPWIDLWVDPAHNPLRVKELLREAVMSCEVAPKSPEPVFRFEGIKDVGALFRVKVFHPDWESHWQDNFAVNDAISDRIWNHLGNAGIRMLVQHEDIVRAQLGGEDSQGAKWGPFTFLRAQDMFASVSDEDLEKLSKEIEVKWFDKGDVLTQQGADEDNMFAIIEGVVNFTIETQGGQSIFVDAYGAGELFGETALISGGGRQLTATASSPVAVYEISKADMTPVLEKNEELVRRLGKLLSERATERKRLIDQAGAKHDGVDDAAGLSQENMVDRIMGAFGLGKKT